MNSKKLRVFSAFLMILVCVTFSSCQVTDSIAKTLFTSKNNAEELVYSSGKNVQNYEYSKKVLVTISDHYSDKLSLNDGTDYYSTDKDDNFCILTGHFDKVAWNNYKLFINMKDKYYCFDIKSYNVPKTTTSPSNFDDYYVDNNLKPEYELKKFTADDMKKLYPDYQDYEWYGH